MPVIFTIEMVLKWVALGVAFTGEDAYMRDSWNVLDFSVSAFDPLRAGRCVSTEMHVQVVALGYLKYIDGISNFTVLSTLRLLRPLRAINKLPALRVMVSSLLSSLSALLDMLYLLMFLLFVFGIVGMQLFGGELRQRCFYQATGSCCETFFACDGSAHCPRRGRRFGPPPTRHCACG